MLNLFQQPLKELPRLLTQFFASEPDRLIGEQGDKDFTAYTTKKKITTKIR
jgi:hypothetical protein